MSLKLEREKEEDDERAESEAEGKESLALQDEEHLRTYAASLEEIAGQREAQANASLVLEQRAEAEAQDARERAQEAQAAQERAEEAEQLALQRMHALEASGMQDSHELLRLREELRSAQNLTDEWRVESSRQQSAFEQVWCVCVCVCVCGCVWVCMCVYVCMHGWMDGWKDG